MKLNRYYLKNLVYLQSVLKEKAVYPSKDENNTLSTNSNILSDVVKTVCFVLLFCLLFFGHHLVTDRFALDNYGFPDMGVFLWYLGSKLSLLIPLFIWFKSCTRWWRYAILSPIIIFSYQVYEVFLNGPIIEGAGNLKAVPSVLFVLLILVAISRIVNYRTKILNVHEALKKEINVLLNYASQEDVTMQKQHLCLEQIKNSLTEGKEKNITSLMEIKEAIENELNKKQRK